VAGGDHHIAGRQDFVTVRQAALIALAFNLLMVVALKLGCA